MKLIDLTGQRFGRLVVVGRVECEGETRWECRCDCGNTKVVFGGHLRRGNTLSCGCQRAAFIAQSKITHGETGNRLYRVWACMKSRCHTPSNTSYKRYGAVGVKVCDEWQDYETFRAWALANGYDETAPRGKCTLDRIDPYGNYEPSNCRWATASEQNKNKRAKEGKA